MNHHWFDEDHLISHIAKKKTTKEMFNALVMLYQSVHLSGINNKMLLKNKLADIGMSKTNTVVIYLMKIRELGDQLTAIEKEIDESELVWITLTGFGLLWHHFVQCICACEKLPSFVRLCHDFAGEETRLEMVSTKFKKAQDLALIGKWGEEERREDAKRVQRRRKSWDLQTMERKIRSCEVL